MSQQLKVLLWVRNNLMIETKLFLDFLIDPVGLNPAYVFHVVKLSLTRSKKDFVTLRLM